MSDDLLPVENLQRLARQDGVDVRPTLIRVLTDLFVQKADHSQQDLARYEELTMQLLDVVGVEARAAVARKLAEDTRAPRRVIDRLLADDISVAAPILSRRRDIPREALLALAFDGGVAEAAAVAARPDIDADMVRTLAHHADEFVLETLAANPAAAFTDGTLTVLADRATRSPTLAVALLRRGDIDAGALAPLYLQAEPARRDAIRMALETRPGRLAAEARPTRNTEALDTALVEAATETGRGHKIAEALGEALALRPEDASRLATEPSGEAFVMMLRAAGVGAELVARALLVAQPEIAKSVARFFQLVDIAETTPRGVASQIVAALVGATSRSATARHEPALDPSGVMERAGAARQSAARRPAASRADTTRNRG